MGKNYWDLETCRKSQKKHFSSELKVISQGTILIEVLEKRRPDNSGETPTGIRIQFGKKYWYLCRNMQEKLEKTFNVV